MSWLSKLREKHSNDQDSNIETSSVNGHTIVKVDGKVVYDSQRVKKNDA